MECPFGITVFDKAFGRRGFVGDPTALVTTVRHNAIGTSTLTLPADHRRVADLAARGARVVITYDGQHLLSGPVRRLRAVGPRSSSTVAVDVEDDLRLLFRVLGWPNPAAALTAQTPAYDKRSGPAETVLKGYVTANAVTRLGLPVTVAPNLARGGSISTALRFNPLADKLLLAVDQAGLGVTVRQSGAGLLLDVYEPTTYPRTLTERSGVVVTWEFSTAGPTVTRGVTGDQGELTARSFTAFSDPARESEFGDVIEVFRDARDTAAPAEVAARSAETLAEGAPKTGIKVELAETKTFRYGSTVRVGDRVPLEVGPGFTHTDVLREAVLSFTRDQGLVVTPVVGERTDEPSTALAKALGRSLAAIRDLRAGR